MTSSKMKGLALCGLVALLVGGGTAASAQGDYQGDGHHHIHHARQAIMRQKMAYSRAVAHGNYRAAERAHLKARAIRHHVRAHHMMHTNHGL